MKRKAVHSSDLLWWILGGLIGVIASNLPVWFASSGSTERKLLLEYGGIFAGSVLLGYLRSSHPWRWGLSCVLFVPFVETAKRMEELEVAKQAVTPQALFPQGSIEKYLLLLLTGLAGGYVGAFFSWRQEVE